ncbi:MAG: hypothetical protein ACRDR6_06335 [Pseudonocardiaceae bacterium]
MRVGEPQELVQLLVGVEHAIAGEIVSRPDRLDILSAQGFFKRSTCAGPGLDVVGVIASCSQ